jgi:hypothetical protein
VEVPSIEDVRAAIELAETLPMALAASPSSLADVEAALETS